MSMAESDIEVLMWYCGDQGGPEGQTRWRLVLWIFPGADGRRMVRYKKHYGDFGEYEILLASFAKWAVWSHHYPFPVEGESDALLVPGVTLDELLSPAYE